MSVVEFAALVEAARAARMTPSGYLAQVALGTATGTATPSMDLLRQLLGAVVEATGEVARLADALPVPAEPINGAARNGVPRPISVVLERLDDATLECLAQLRRRP